MQPIFNYFKKPSDFFLALLKKFGPLFTDEAYLKIMFRLKMGYNLNLNNPTTFGEKLQWLKLYNKNPSYRIMVDKLKAKEYVSKVANPNYVIKTIGIWETFDEIDFEKLPQKFVLKTNNGGGSQGIIICKDKRNLDLQVVRKNLEMSLHYNIYKELKEWPYKGMKPQIFAEELIETKDKTDIDDYKFYCFNGKVIFCEVISDRFIKKTIDFFDLDWNHQPFCFKGISFSESSIKKPKNFDEMVSLAAILSKDIPYSRIDLYNVEGKVYFGEITFFPASGFLGFYPEEWNVRLGDMIKLLEKKQTKNN